jgi:hypothetical protein
VLCRWRSVSQRNGAAGRCPIRGRCAAGSIDSTGVLLQPSLKVIQAYSCGLVACAVTVWWLIASRPVTLAQVRQAQAVERAAKDAFYAVAASVKPGAAFTAEHAALQAAMVAATKARQAALTAYAATLA